MSKEEHRRGDTETRGRGEKKELSSSTSSVAASPRRRVSASSLRVFCAVELPAETRERVAAHIARLRAAVPDARASWPRAENLHLTLKFLGEIASARVEALSSAASRAVQDMQPFKLTLEGAGAFPPRSLPRVIWLGIEDSSGKLARLQSNLEEQCANANFPREERSFHPHLTLARIRAPQGARELARLHRETGFEPIEFAVTELVVMRSELGAGGSRYTPVSRHGLMPTRVAKSQGESNDL